MYPAAVLLNEHRVESSVRVGASATPIQLVEGPSFEIGRYSATSMGSAIATRAHRHLRIQNSDARQIVASKNSCASVGVTVRSNALSHESTLWKASVEDELILLWRGGRVHYPQDQFSSASVPPYGTRTAVIRT
jgi:hypothetical protein